MSINKIALVASAIMLCPIGSVAQNNDTQMVKVEAGVKTYYPSKMGVRYLRNDHRPLRSTRWNP